MGNGENSTVGKLRIRGTLASRMWSTKHDMKNKSLAGFTTVASLAFCLSAFSADEPTKYQFEETVNGQKISVSLETGPFDSNAQQVKHISISTGYLIDGQRPIGSQGDIEAATEFKRFDIYWNGKRVPLNRVAWSSIFNVPLIAIRSLNHEPAGFTIVPSIDGSSLLFYFRPHSGDAEVPEEAWMIVNKMGKFTKFHSN